jgi:beta-glucosidase
MGWGVDPDAFTELLTVLAKEFAPLPLVVTENGSAYPDPGRAAGVLLDADRTAYLTAHLVALHRAIEAGVDVRGYFAWSLLDNFEWAWGYSQRFGIVHVDFATQRRTPKQSGLVFRDLIGANAVPAG